LINDVKAPTELMRLENPNTSKNANVSSDRIKPNQCVICECGAKIYLSCDVKEMGKAIELHAKEHGKKTLDNVSSNAEASRIEDLLTEQVFKAIKSIKKS
jgi:hypothetical protein